jgi:hypothetical protein
MCHLVCGQRRSDHLGLAAALSRGQAAEPLHVGIVEIDAGLLHACSVSRRANLTSSELAGAVGSARPATESVAVANSTRCPAWQARIAMPVARCVLLVPGVMATDCDAAQLVPVVDSRSLADVAREFDSQAGGSWSGPIVR